MMHPGEEINLYTSGAIQQAFQPVFETICLPLLDS